MTVEPVCENCEYRPTQTTPHCPECGAERPWAWVPAYEFDEGDLPHVFSVDRGGDADELWAAFCESYFGERLVPSAIHGLPDDFPEMSGFDARLWFVVTTDRELEGPFLDEDRARGAVGAAPTDD